MRILPRFQLIPVCAALGVSSGPVAGQNPVGNSDLKALITGNTIHYENLANGQTGRAYYAVSGEILIKRDDDVEFSGLWSIGANGAHCMLASFGPDGEGVTQAARYCSHGFSLINLDQSLGA